MSKNEKIDEIERLLKELKASKEETAVTVDETVKRPSGFWSVGKIFFSLWKKSFLLIALLVLVLICSIAFYRHLLFEKVEVHLRKNKVHFLSKFKI